MSLKDTINTNIKEAMKAKDQGALRALRAVKSAILLAETAEGAGDALTPDQEMQILMKQVKQRRDSIEQFRSNGREDLAAAEEEEVNVIQEYLPKQLEGAELEAEVKKIIEVAGATSMKDMGKVMGMASKQLAGKADGKAISALVKQILG